MSKLTVEQRKQALAAFYAERFRCPELLKPVHYVEKNWSADEYAGGGFVFNYPPGVLTSLGCELRRPHGRVYFAGSETATSWIGCFEGAVQSAERAAREVLHELGKLPVSELGQKEPDGDSGSETVSVQARRRLHSWNALSLVSVISAATVSIGVASVFVHRYVRDKLAL
jgi:monoamine oxidase